jgi:hypothetical protein
MGMWSGVHLLGKPRLGDAYNQKTSSLYMYYVNANSRYYIAICLCDVDICLGNLKFASY